MPLDPSRQGTVQRLSRRKFPSLKRKEEDTVGYFLDWGRQQLSILGLREARTNTERILEEALGLRRTDLYLERGRRVRRAATAVRIRHWVGKRKKRIPLGHLTGKAYFWNETLSVGPGCFIPRPETEILVERFLEHPEGFAGRNFSFLDLACGSGAIGIAVLRECPRSQATFADLSKNALKMTRRNLKRYGLVKRAKVVGTDLFVRLKGLRWDVIFCNPPYFSRKDWHDLEPEVRRDPRMALEAGRDGLRFYRRIAAEAKMHLNPGGRIYFEVGKGQAHPVQKLLVQAGLKAEGIYKDYRGIARVVAASTG